MKTQINLELTKYPKVLSELLGSNQFLKMLSIVTCIITSFSLIIVWTLVNRSPIVLTLSPSANLLNYQEKPNLEFEVKAAILKYIDLRYKWDSSNVKENLKAAEIFILPKVLSSYQKAEENIIKFALDKQISQKVYIDSVDVQLESGKVTVFGNRFSALQGIKAAADLKLELNFEFGTRTPTNPWGVYLSKENELN